MERQRIAILDGYRALAIVLVIGFHYFSRWTPPKSAENLYPYGGVWASFPMFKYGYLGVEFFFIISGFVISLTLAGSHSWQDFAIKRFARLFPAMLLCSALTFATLMALPLTLFQPTIRDFVPSLSFVDPELIRIATGLEFNPVDGAYWSLFVEAKFYFWACILYFAARSKHFLVVFGVFFNIVLMLAVAAKLLNSEALKTVVSLLLIREHLPWFAAGVAYYYLYRGEKNILALLLAAESLVVTSGFSLAAGNLTPIVFYFAFHCFFALFIYRSGWVQFFAYKPVALLGAASYSLYLLHQNLGVTLIAQLADWLDFQRSAYSVVLGVAVFLLLALAAIFIYRCWELPAKRAILGVGKVHRGQ